MFSAQHAFIKAIQEIEVEDRTTRSGLQLSDSLPLAVTTATRLGRCWTDSSGQCNSPGWSLLVRAYRGSTTKCAGRESCHRTIRISLKTRASVSRVSLHSPFL